MKRSLIILLFFLCGCIDPFPVEVSEGESLLHVEGYITTDPGPHTIKLTRTATYGSVFVDFIRRVSQATVGIQEVESGQVTFLTETETGTYVTPNGFSAEIGKSYSLRILTRDGEEYVSEPQNTLPVPEIDSLAYRTIVIPTTNRLFPKSGLQFISFFKDPPGERNFYHWKIENRISRVSTFPELYRPRGSLPEDPPQPKDCCTYCFVPDMVPFRNIFIAEDTGFDGLATSQIAGFLEDNGFRFMHRFRFDFQQMAISAETYRYLRLIDQQLSLTGSVFDPPPARLRGNIINLNDPDETVLGHFFSADVVSKRIYLRREDLDLIQSQLRFEDDCRELSNSTVEGPEDWDP